MGIVEDGDEIVGVDMNDDGDDTDENNAAIANSQSDQAENENSQPLGQAYKLMNKDAGKATADGVYYAGSQNDF